MNAHFTQFSWPVSPYSAKTRTYLRFKRIPFDEVEPSARMLFRDIKREVGAAIMPTVLTPEGTWLQDSSEIIDTLEARFPEAPVIPTTPKQRISALLLEVLADEWLPMVALHYRWNRHENKEFAISEFGRYAFPMAPAGLQRLVARPVANKMAGYRPVVGITQATIPGIERFAEALIADLNAHLRAHPFLFGTRPSIADFALFGPLWAHLYRDPATTYLFAEAPFVVSWFERLITPWGRSGEFLADDTLPDTLNPLLEVTFAECMVFMKTLVAAIDTYCDQNPSARRVPRSLGDAHFVVGGARGERKLLTYAQWMVQRPLDVYARLHDAEHQEVDTWLRSVAGESAVELMSMKIRHPFERRDFKMRLAGA